MTRSERTLAGVLGAAIVLAGGFQVTRFYVITPRAKLQEDIARELAQHQKLEDNLAPSVRAAANWRERVQTTLGPTLEQARLAFRNDLGDLLKRNNLNKDMRIADKGATPFKKGPREGFVELPVNITVRGELGDLVNFLKDFYQRPYLKRIDALSISASAAQAQQAAAKRKTGKDKLNSGPTEHPAHELSIALTLTTLVAPSLPKYPAPTLTAEQLASGEPPTSAPSWIEKADPVAYNRIANVNIFKIYEPPPPPPPPPGNRDVVVKRDDRQPPPPPPPDPRKDAGNFRLLGVTSLQGELIAYVQDERERSEAAQQHRLNDMVDDGRLVLVHRLGIVIRSRADDGRTTDWFYPLGATFDEREELSKSEHPEVWQSLQQVTRRS